MKTKWLALTRAHEEPMIVVYTTWLALFIILVGGIKDSMDTVLFGCKLMIGVGLCYLALTLREILK